jgi:hypothetical protein
METTKHQHGLKLFLFCHTILNTDICQKKMNLGLVLKVKFRILYCLVLIVCLLPTIVCLADNTDSYNYSEESSPDSIQSTDEVQFSFNPVERYPRALFVSAFGGANILSLNYEHGFPGTDNYFFSMRGGIGLSNRGASIFGIGSFTPFSRVMSLQSALVFNYGKGIHNLELAYGVGIYQGGGRRDIHTFPTIGYKIQPLKKEDYENVYYFRIFSDMLFLTKSMDYQLVITPPIGISIGGKF